MNGMCAYLCIFVFIFLGILGAVNVVFSIGELLHSEAVNTVVSPKSSSDIEYLVRRGLKSCSGKVIVRVKSELYEQSEFAEICGRLCRENPRVVVKQEK